MRLPLIIFIGYFALLAASLIAQETETSAQSNELKSQAHFDELLQKAKGGGMDAAFELGVSYLEVEVEKRNLSEGWRWLGEAARLGHAEAQCLMGLQSQFGKGGEDGKKDAVKWFTLATEKEHLESMLLLGHRYSRGDIVPKDEVKALSLFKRVMKLGRKPQMRLPFANIEIIQAEWTLKDSLIEAAERGDVASQALIGHEPTNVILGLLLSESTTWLIKAAEQGHVESQFRAGTAYLTGRGVTQDFEKAAKWYQKAAEKPSADIAARWACMLLRGAGVSINIPEAAKWFRKSVELGGPGVESSFQQFEMLYGRYLTKASFWSGTPEMVVLYLKASVDNDAESQFKYAALHQAGGAITWDDEEAVRWWKKAGENGHAEAQFNVGESYARGRGSEQSDTQAAKWYQMAAAQGHQEAQYKLGLMHSYGRGVTKDELVAVKLLLKAAEQGHTKASTAIGRRYLEGKGFSKDLSKAADWLIKAAINDDAEGQFLLGFMFLNGLGMTVDYKEAAKWFSLAADEGIADAQFHLGILYAIGDGVPKNDLIAYKWLLLAKAKGIQESTKPIESIEKKLSPEQRAEVQKIAGEFVPKKERETKKRIQEMREKREEMRSRMFDPVSGNDKGDIKAKEPRVNTNGNK